MSESTTHNNSQSSGEALISPSSSLPSLPRTLQLGIMASGKGTNFEAVAKAIADGKLDARIQVVIYNNPDAKVKERAEKYDIPTVFVDHREYERRENFDHEIVAVLKSYAADWVVMAGWMRIITQVMLDGYPKRILNIHPSLLPSFKGNKAVEQTLEAGVKIAGCTVHLVDLEVDSGQIIMQAAVPVLEEDTVETLHARIQQQEYAILPQAIAIAGATIKDDRFGRIG